MGYSDHMSPQQREKSLETSLLAARVATRHYLEGRTNVEVAEELGISRFRVARLLDVARDEGIVRFSINLPLGMEAELSEGVRQRYDLDHCLVVPGTGDQEVLRDRLGRTAAALLHEVVGEDDVLGVAWGRTLSAMTRHLDRLPPCPIVQLTGVAGDIAENSVELIRQISDRSGGQAFPIYAPMVLPDASTLNGLRRQDSVARAISRHRHVTVAVVAVGSWEPPDSQLLSSLTPRSRQRLVRHGVRAEMCGTLLTGTGAEVSVLSEHLLAIEPAQLRRIPQVLAVAGGESKINAIRSALASGLISSLVTDESVAEALLSG